MFEATEKIALVKKGIACNFVVHRPAPYELRVMLRPLAQPHQFLHQKALVLHCGPKSAGDEERPDMIDYAQGRCGSRLQSLLMFQQ
jgi:hypothetical protein